MFLDVVKIWLSAGDGGDGCVAFHREKYVASGGPSGGDGGHGGDVFFQADGQVSTLSSFRYRKRYNAGNGKKGESGRRSGKKGEDLILLVPPGTLVKDARDGRILADISGNLPILIAKGGRGGWGNARFATPTRQTPRFAKPGVSGEQFELTLELKLLADVGLVGYPNVGKSSLLSVVSEARPEVGNYHFTTLTPVLGVVRFQDLDFIMADIPGLIEGASAGTGLGHAFLRHVERCRMLVHVLDAAGSEGRNPLEDFHGINEELRQYLPELAERPQLVVANKTDLATEEQLQALREEMELRCVPYVEICAVTHAGVEALLKKIVEMLSMLPPIRSYEAEESEEIFPEIEENYQVFVEDGTYVVEAPWLVRILNNSNHQDYESLQYFQRVLEKSGVAKELLRLGIQEGDTVSVGDFEFDYVE